MNKILFNVLSAFLLSALYNKEIASLPNQATHFFASAQPGALLIKEPVEWPVKAAYGIPGIRFLTNIFLHTFGEKITRQQERAKKKTDKKIIKKQIEHYLTFYKDFIDMSIFTIPAHGFATFNDWFIRTLKNPEKDRPLENSKKAIASPADSKLIIVPNISVDTEITIKEKRFNCATFLNDSHLAKEYEEGTMMIFRLAPYDYHRYHYPIDCTVSPEISLNGAYHSVNRRAFFAKAKPLTENKRVYQVLTPAHSLKKYKNEKIIMVAVGATAVGSVVNTSKNYPLSTIFSKGSEAGYFQFGGSTIVLLFKKDTIKLDKQIEKNSLAGYETAVKVRQTIAHWA